MLTVSCIQYALFGHQDDVTLLELVDGSNLQYLHAVQILVVCMSLAERTSSANLLHLLSCVFRGLLTKAYTCAWYLPSGTVYLLVHWDVFSQVV